MKVVTCTMDTFFYTTGRTWPKSVIYMGRFGDLPLCSTCGRHYYGNPRELPMHVFVELQTTASDRDANPPRRRVPRHLKALRHSRSVARRNARQRLKARRRPQAAADTSRRHRLARQAITRQAARGATTLPVPENLSLTAASEESIRFLAQLRQVCCEKPVARVFIDHSQVRSVTPEAGLVLIAEFTRAHAYAPTCVKECNRPTDPDSAALLGEIGYWRYVPGLDQDTWSTPGKSKRFFKHITDARTTGSVVKELISHFGPAAHFEQEESKALYKAIIECMENTAGHAYPERRTGQRYLYGKWWLLGGCDDESGEIFFVFYDQGLGIPGTIRARLRDKVPFLARTDEDLIVKAVVEGRFSRHKTQNRGRGLPQLKAFIDASAQGQLVIVSNQSRCIFRKGQGPTTERLPVSLPGTLVVWNLQR